MASFGNRHPDHDCDHDINQGNQKKQNPPQRFFGDVQHQNNVRDRNPGEPAVFGVGLGGDGLQRQSEIDVDSQSKDQAEHQHAQGNGGLNGSFRRSGPAESGQNQK